GLVLANVPRGRDGTLIPDRHSVSLGTIDRDDDSFMIHYCQAAKLKFTLREAGDNGADENKRTPLDFDAYYIAHSQPGLGHKAQAYSSLIYDSRRLEFDTHPDEDIAFEIRRPGYKPFRETFRLRPGEIRTVDVEFKQQISTDKAATAKRPDKIRAAGTPAVGNSRKPTFEADELDLDLQLTFQRIAEILPPGWTSSVIDH